jgi:hypothetical protein
MSGLGRLLGAGMLGGAAELAWVALYCGPVDGAEVARQVTETLVSGAGASTHALAWGIGIHMALSLLLALAYGLLVWEPLRHRLGGAAAFVFSCSALAAVWALNFFVVLPIVNPAFVELMPYSVTLASKLMFGMAMAAALTWKLRPSRAPEVYASILITNGSD